MFKKVLIASSFLWMFIGFSAWGTTLISTQCQVNSNGLIIDPTDCLNAINNGESDTSETFSAAGNYINTNNESIKYNLSYKSFQEVINNFNDKSSLPGFNVHYSKAMLSASGFLGGVYYYALYNFGPSIVKSCTDASGCYENLFFSYTNKQGRYVVQQFQSGRTYTPTTGGSNSNNSSSSLPPQFASATNDNGIITGTGDESLSDVLQDWLKSGAGKAFLTGYLQTRVAVAPFDPVAGNPSSFMGQAVQENYDLANLVNFQTAPQAGLNLFNLMPQYSIFNADGVTQNQYSLPLRDVYYINQSNSLEFDLPMSYTDTSGSTTYAVSAGIAYAHMFALPLNTTWSVSPSLHIGADGSESFAAATLIYNGGLSSNIVIPVNQFSFGLTDNVTYLKTAAVNISGYETAYDMNATLTENGVDANFAITPKFSVGTNFSNTYLIAGDSWYINNYNQVGGSVSLNKDYKGTTYNFITIGASYLFAPHFNGENINIGLNF